MEQEEIQEVAKEEKRHTIKKENSETKKNLAMEDLAHHQETAKKALAINQNHLAHHQEMERKKVLVTRENLVLEISQNHLVMEDLAHHQETVRKKVLVTRENLVLLKKMTRNQQASQIILNILEKKHLKVHQRVEKKKALVLMERRSLKAEVIDLKASPLKSIVKKEQNLNIYIFQRLSSHFDERFL